MKVIMTAIHQKLMMPCPVRYSISFLTWLFGYNQDIGYLVLMGRCAFTDPWEEDQPNVGR